MRKILLILIGMLAGPMFVEAQYHDAEVFEAKGRVKMITEDYTRLGRTIRSTYSFSPSGELLATQQGKIVSLERDGQGRLAKYVYNDAGSYYQYEYDGQGRVIRRFFPSGKAEYEYNDKGLMIQEIGKFFSTTCIRYTYLAFDEQGNWTERICDREGEEAREKRVITYWPESVATETSVPTGPRRMIRVQDQIDPGENVRYVDEKYRGLLECVLHGSQNDYIVTLGQTTLYSMSQLEDMVYTDVRGSGKDIRILQIDGDKDKIIFHSSPTGALRYIDYKPHRIPESWKTLYGIDQNIYRDPNRKQKLVAQGFKFLSEAKQTIFEYGTENYYIGKDPDSRVILLSLLTDSDEPYLIRISLEDDEDGHFPQLREKASDTKNVATTTNENRTTSSSGGGFLKAFDKLAQKTAQREAQATASTASGEVTAANVLSARSMVDHPFGVLDCTVTAQEAVQQLLAKGWMAELLNNRIELSPKSKYDLTYKKQIPNASAVFSEAGRLLSYEYTFSTIGGEDAESKPLSSLRLQSVRFAYLLAAELEAQGIKLMEKTADQTKQEELKLCWENEDRTVQIYVIYDRRNGYVVTLRAQLR